MCGIVGSLILGEGRVSAAALTRMRDSMTHRGPDGEGLWISQDGRVGLGHRRLAIIDLSPAAHQPMASADGRYWLVFNGEIYNHAELRRELTALGHRHWQTDHSDTEVLLQAFQEWGIDCLERFRGMFAFALWDDQKQELWLVRDRIGVKPLYYSFHHNRLTFASEIKALLLDPEQPRQVNEESLFHYLSFLTTPAPDTLFAGIRKLAGGTWLKVTRDGCRTERRYWDVWDHTQPLINTPEAELIDRIRHEIRTSVQLRQISDVPVGVFLSGGIDSSTNAALFAETAPTPLKTFSIGYDGHAANYPSELPFARQMAKQVGAEHHERILGVQDLLDFLPQMVRQQDEPIADPVCVPVYYVAQLARQHGVTVCQLGEGSDELFWGYPSWKTALRAQQFAGMLPVQPAMWALARLGKEQHHYFEWLRRIHRGQPLFWGGAEAFSQRQKEMLLSPRLRAQFAGLTSWEALRPIHDRFRAGAWETAPLQWMSYLDLNLRLPELLLMRVDKMTMAVGLEGRVPFLDHKLVELALSLSQQQKTRHGTLKYLLKQAVHGLIPQNLIDRPKQGFGVPLHEWFVGQLGDLSAKELDWFCRETDFLDPLAVQRLRERGSATEQWYLLNLALWWKTFV